jgi:hypothetical protein
MLEVRSILLGGGGVVLLYSFQSFFNFDFSNRDGAEASLAPSAGVHALATDNVYHNIPIINHSHKP